MENTIAPETPQLPPVPTGAPPVTWQNQPNPGKPRPLCKACGTNKAALREYTRAGTPTYRSTCASCHRRARAAFTEANGLPKPAGTVAPTKEAVRKLKGHTSCMLCGWVPVHQSQLEIDHLDENRGNNTPGNLLVLCCNCHRLKTGIDRGWVDPSDPRVDQWLQDPTRPPCDLNASGAQKVRWAAQRAINTIYYDGEAMRPSDFLRAYCPWCSLSAGIQYLKRHTPEETIEHYRPKG